jgi:hypothetical protein
VHQIAEFPAAEWIVAKILNDGSAISKGVRLPDLIFGKAGILLQ